MRSYLFHLPLVKAVLEVTGGKKNKASKFLKEITLPLFEVETEENPKRRKSILTICIASIMALLFFSPNGLKDFHSTISPTHVEMRTVIASMQKLKEKYEKCIGEEEKGTFDRLVADSEESENHETRGMCRYLREWINVMPESDKITLDGIAQDSLQRSYGKHQKEMIRWKAVADQIPPDTIVTATSRRVESAFSELKNLERSHWRMRARRLFVITMTKVKKQCLRPDLILFIVQ